MLKKKQEVSIQHMFRHACAFVDCATACEIEPSHIKPRTASHLTANMVNSALACEIFLKALLVSYGTNLSELQDEHRLKELWKRYRKKDKYMARKIEKSINRWFRTKNNTLFYKFLKESSSVFVNWRYIYEFDGAEINSHFLRGFRSILREVCCQRVYRKSWETYVDEFPND